MALDRDRAEAIEGRRTYLSRAEPRDRRRLGLHDGHRGQVRTEVSDQRSLDNLIIYLGCYRFFSHCLSNGKKPIHESDLDFYNRANGGVRCLSNSRHSWG